MATTVTSRASARARPLRRAGQSAARRAAGGTRTRAGRCAAQGAASGQLAPIVILPGLGNNAADYTPMVEALKARAPGRVVEVCDVKVRTAALAAWRSQ